MNGASATVAGFSNALLGGSANFEPDRDGVRRAVAIYPGLRKMARDNRLFVIRAATAAVKAGIRQFVDLGSGIPAELPPMPPSRVPMPSVAGAIHAADPGAVVVCVDHDAAVLAHARYLAGLPAVNADLADAEAVLGRPGLLAAVDLTRPVCVILSAVLHFWPAGAAAGIVAGYAARIAEGSRVIVSVASFGDDAVAGKLAEAYGFGWHNHGSEEMRDILAGLEVEPPGIVDARAWRPCVAGPRQAQDGIVLAGMGIRR